MSRKINFYGLNQKLMIVVISTDTEKKGLAEALILKHVIYIEYFAPNHKYPYLLNDDYSELTCSLM